MMKKSKGICAALLLTALSLPMAACAADVPAAPASSAGVTDTAAQTAAAGQQGAAVQPTKEDRNAALAAHIEALSNGDSTHYEVFVAYPLENREYVYQSAPMRSASMIKVFILATAMERVKAGTLALDQTLTLHSSDKVGGAGVIAGYASGTELSLDTVMRFMITESDNTATNMMIDLLGMDAINAYIQQHGYHDTSLQRKMMDSAAVAAGRDNYTSAADLGHFFVTLYNRCCVSPELDDVMLGYLAGQTDTECFPAAMPGVMIAHKTGELGGLYDDGGIIYQEGRPFIMVGMTAHYSGRGTAIRTLQAMLRAAAEE